MVQITPESMASLKQALRDMKDYTIGCGSIESQHPEEQVFVQWIDEDRNINVGYVLLTLDPKNNEILQPAVNMTSVLTKSSMLN